MITASKSKKETWFDSKNIITIIFLSVSLSFTVFFFSPVDIFLGNQKEFYINAWSVILPMLLLAVAASLALMLIMSLSLLNRTVYNAVTSLLFGILLAFYVQMMLFNGNLRLMDGDNVTDLYTEVTFANIADFIIIYIIFMLPLIMTSAREKSGNDNALMNFARGRVISYLSVVIFAMQFFGSAGMLISNGLIKTNNDEYLCFSFEPFTSVSADGNITVFLLDRLDGEWMEETLELYPEINEKLEGFTFYQNNVSCYSNTFPSVPCMLTNTEYDIKESRYEFIERAWQEESLAGILSKNDYRINLFLDRTTTFNSFGQLSECSNIVPLELNDYEINYFGENGIIEVMTRLSFTKLTPYFFKGYFTLWMKSPIDEDFLKVNDNVPDTLMRLMGAQSDIAFNKFLGNYGLKADSEQKTFNFIHMNGAHDDSLEISLLSPSYESDTNSGIYTTIRGNFETLFTYFDMMKELGVYDNSTIIIIADHGRPQEFSTAALLIKPENAGTEPLQFDDESELSNANFFPGILEYAGIDHSEYGYSYNDIINNELHPDRYFMYANGSQIYSGRFVIKGDAGDKSNWTEIPLDK